MVPTPIFFLIRFSYLKYFIIGTTFKIMVDLGGEGLVILLEISERTVDSMYVCEN